jgi:MFS family permease
VRDTRAARARLRDHAGRLRAPVQRRRRERVPGAHASAGVRLTGAGYQRRWLALALLAATQFVVVLDISIVNVALPSIGAALDSSQENLSWVVNAYALTFGGFLLLGGRLADLLGRRRVFMAGLGFAFVTTTIAALSGVEELDSGLASGLIHASQQIGGALGLAVLATIATSRTDDVLANAGGDPAALPNALTEGFQSALLGGSAIAALGLTLTLVLIRGRDSKAHVEAGRLEAEPRPA